jgi:hypothetical protein
MKPASLFEQALVAEGVTGRMADLARSIHMQESGGGKNTTTSNAGARGGMQIIPSTFSSVADKDWNIDDPMQNARAGIRYIKQLDARSGGNSELTAVGYYGGPGAMKKALQGKAVSDPRNPNAPNTLQYAQKVVSRMGGKAGNAQPGITQLATQADRNRNPASAPLPSAIGPDVVARAAPSMEAMPPEVALIQQAQAQTPVGNEAEQAWGQFMQQMPKRQAEQARAMASYSQPRQEMPRFVDPGTGAPMADTAVDFRAFGALRGRG